MEINWEAKVLSSLVPVIENSEEVREMFKEYVTALSGDNKEKEIVQEEISEEDLDSLPISNTKH